MYLDFYGLKNFPFHIISDPHFFFESASHKEAFVSLLYGVRERKGIILVTGEVGTGKTTLCKTFLSSLPKEVKSSLILNPYFSEVQLLRAIVDDFGIMVKGKTRLDIIKALNAFLLEISSNGGNAVLIVDEAQSLGKRQLEQIRLLSNLEVSSGKLLQIVLCGQPELQEKLEDFSLRQIRQRICVKYCLSPLREEEVKDYVRHRLKKGGEGDINILASGFGAIYEFSRGNPRLINILCDRALLCGFSRGVKVFDAQIFNVCAQELR